MNSYNEIFKNKALIGYVTASDPSIEATEAAIEEMIKKGFSLVEIGIPFSDPTCEDDYVAESMGRALLNGVTTDSIFDMLKRIKAKYPSFPFVIYSYLNPVFAYGYDEFFNKCNECNIIGTIIPDLPCEEKEEVESVSDKYNQTLIKVLAPTCINRVEKIVSDAKGYVYLPYEADESVVKMINEIRKYTKTPICIRNNKFETLDLSDGVVVNYMSIVNEE